MWTDATHFNGKSITGKSLVQDLRMHNMDSNEGFGRMDLEGITIVV